MIRSILPFLVFAWAISSCKPYHKEVDKLDIAKEYYEALDQSNIFRIQDLITDTLLTRENESGYEQMFSNNEYVEWIRWDSVFRPSYKILEIIEEDEFIRVTVSKMDIRISFLHNEPIVTEQMLRFDTDRISSVETTEYLTFNDSLFVSNRDRFLKWIDDNHPNLNGFIYDQTKDGGLKYLNAIRLYNMQN